VISLTILFPAFYRYQRDDQIPKLRNHPIHRGHIRKASMKKRFVRQIVLYLQFAEPVCPMWIHLPFDADFNPIHGHIPFHVQSIKTSQTSDAVKGLTGGLKKAGKESPARGMSWAFRFLR
jgi:hypothetical protein